MKMNIVKQVDVNATIDSKDMGVALAVATQDEQISFIEAMVKEFNSWGNFDRDTQIIHIIDEIQESEHKEEIVKFFKTFVDFYSIKLKNPPLYFTLTKQEIKNKEREHDPKERHYQ